MDWNAGDSIKAESAGKWFEEGDSNTKYLNNLIRDKMRRLQLHRITNHRDRWVHGDEKIAKAAIHHYEHLFNLKNQFRDHEILENSPCCIINEDNDMLTTITDLDEIREEIFSMSANNSAGPDGYNDSFFHKYWDIIKNDIKNFVQVSGRSLTKFYSHTCLVLIPKIDSQSNFSNLRPISLSNFFSKIISKILSIRLNPLLSKLIWGNQSSFIKGRMITENVLLAHELDQVINHSNMGWNMIIKLDMAKAYDRMS